MFGQLVLLGLLWNKQALDTKRAGPLVPAVQCTVAQSPPKSNPVIIMEGAEAGIQNAPKMPLYAGSP